MRAHRLPRLLVLLAAACGSTDAPPAPDLLPHPAPLPAQGQVCTADHLCWSAPLPSGTSVQALWGSAFDDVWAGGDALLHFDGAAWSMAALPLQPGEAVHAISGSGRGDVWAGGERLLHFDGRAWTEQKDQPAGTVLALAAWSGGVLAIIDSGDGPAERVMVAERRGGHWTTVVQPLLPELRALWVAADGGEAWAVGFDVVALKARALHRSAAGQPFAEVSAPGTSSLLALWAASPQDLWAGGGGTLLHWDGARWTAATGIDAKAEIRALWGASSKDVTAAARGGGYHFDGTAWTALLPPAAAEQRLGRALWGSGPRNVWLAGDAGLLWQGDHANFFDATVGNFSFIEAVFAIGPRDAWAVGGQGTAAHWNGVEWINKDTFVSDPLQAVWASSANDVWAAGTSGDCMGFLLHWTGVKWSTAIGPDAGRCYTDLSGTGAADAWAVASRVLLHWNGAKWLGAGGPADPAQSVYAAAAGEVFVLQESIQGGATPPGGVWHLAGAAWTLTKTGATASLRKLWGSGPHDVWAVGDDAAHAWHFDGTAWSAKPTGLDDPSPGLASLWGSGASDVWAASRSAPIVLHWDGSAWTKLSAGGGFRSLSAIGGSGAADVWFVGGEGTILHRGQ